MTGVIDSLPESGTGPTSTEPAASMHHSNAPEWDLIIRPQAGLFDLHLGDLWRYRDLVGLFVWRDFVALYKQTILGPLWYLVQALLTTVTFTIVFGNIAGLSTDELPPFLFYMSGIVLWRYFADCLTHTSTTFTKNARIFGKVYFPRLAIPVSVVLSHLISFGIQFIQFVGFLVYFYWRGSPMQPSLWIVLSPLLVLIMAGLGLGFGIIISSLTTRYRDLQYLVQFGVQLAMYATPVIYPLSAVPERYRWIAMINPVAPVVESFRFAYLGAGTVHTWGLLYSIGFVLLVLTVGILMFNRIERTFMDTV